MTAPPTKTVERRFPAWGDLVAGLSVGAVLIPQSLAYAKLAGVDSRAGLVTAIFPPLVASVLASSRYVQTGPVAITALLVFGAIRSRGVLPGTPDWISQAALLALLVGVIRIGLGLSRGGVIAYLLSQPVVTGFTIGASMLIVAGQLPTAMGATAEGGILAGAVETLLAPSRWQPSAVALTALTVLLVMGGRRLHPLFPGVLVAVVIGVLVGEMTTLSLVGPIAGALSAPSLDLPWSEVPHLLLPAVVVALVGFAEPAAIARTYAAMDRTRWSADRELIAQGAANLAAGLAGGFPVGGSFSRTSVARLSGAKTRWAGAVAGLVVLSFLPFAGVLAPLPQAVLAAVVVAAVAPLIRPGQLMTIWRQSRPQGAVGFGTLAATLLLSPRIDLAVFGGVAASIVIHLWRELHLAVEVIEDGNTLILRPQGVLFFASTPNLEDQLLAALAGRSEVSVVKLELQRLGRIDFTGAVALRTMVDDITAGGIQVQVTGVPPQAAKMFGRVWDQL